MSKIIRDGIDWLGLRPSYLAGAPFPNIFIDDFFLPEVAEQLSTEFLPLNAPEWRNYDNAIENKKLLNHWDKFQPLTYRTLALINSRAFLKNIIDLVDVPELESDPGLNGGGLHIHGAGGKLNVHLDYSVHPKLGMERRVNLLVFLTPGWRDEWGGELQFWSHDSSRNRPRELVSKVGCRFNRAVIFDTAMNSWHGLPDPLMCPDDVARKSLAAYFLSPPRRGIDSRGKALFAPTKEQENDPAVLELIKKRSSVLTASSVYEKPEKPI